jgi:hypothetical protein
MNIPYDRFLWSLLFQLRSNALVPSRPQQYKPIEVKTTQYIQQLIYVYDQGVIQ